MAPLAHPQISTPFLFVALPNSTSPSQRHFPPLVTSAITVSTASHCVPYPKSKPLSSPFLTRPSLSPLRFLCPSPALSRTTALFKFGKDAETAGIYGSQFRDDFDRDDVEQYFNYMGMLATEGTYDKMNELLDQDIHPIDILLLLAASEGDKPKIQELMRAGARCDVPNAEGKTALELAEDDDIREFIKSFAK